MLWPCVVLHCVSLSAGGSIEDVPRGTTAGQILREKGVFAIMDATAGASSSSSSDADALYEGVGVDSGSKGGVAVLQVARQQAPSSDVGQQLVNVNNRLVSEDTVLQDGDLVILAREKIKI
jgi:hypothetical protein